ncbi:hypothetical protein GWK47_013784 [Chionoecetes opilio]|uniref:CCHC-type domain-containing protein n=1 Tax=Chionoecetes opilio TaxID=41210 RepID=A0A8J4Y485_CHIOP|nr:hypothetical protein GWK47_013784 [Chionoecetes opilio]
MADPAAAVSNPTTLGDLVELLKQQFQVQTQQLGAQTRQALAEGQQAQAQAISELIDAYQSGLGDFREEARQFTENSCLKVKNEVMEQVVQLKKDIKDQVVSQLDTVVAGLSGEVSRLEGRIDGVQQAVAPGKGVGAGSVRSGSPCADDRKDEGEAEGRTPYSHRGVFTASSWKGDPGRALSPSRTLLSTSPCTPPMSPSTVPHRESAGRRKPQDFDGRVSLEAYLAQFELLAEAQGWSLWERAVQLASSLKGPAVKVLSLLTPVQRSSSTSIVAVLEQRYGHKHQAEVFRARFWARIRARGETLQQLAQDVEHLARKAYPGATEDLLTVLLRDQFVDALDDQQLKVYVMQVHVGDLQEALARALEFESFVQSSSARPRLDQVRRDFRARRSQRRSRVEEGATGSLPGECWSCRRMGHTRRSCPDANSSLSGKRRRASEHQSGCRECGQTGHLASSCPRAEQEDTSSSPGNAGRLGGRGRRQPSPEVEQLPVYVVSIQDSCLMGLDYLKKSRALVDYGNMTMRVRDVVVPLLELSGHAQGMVARTVSVPLRSETRVRCRLSRRMASELGLVEPSPAAQLQDGLVVGRALVQRDKDEVNVLVANVTDK